MISKGVQDVFKATQIYTYMPRSKVIRVHRYSFVELLQDRVWEDSTTICHEEALTLNLSQQQHHCWVFRGHI